MATLLTFRGMDASLLRVARGPEPTAQPMKPQQQGFNLRDVTAKA